MFRTRPLSQQYHLYTPTDFKVWQLLYDRQMNLLNTHASHLYLQSLVEIGFNRYEIPVISKTNDRLLTTTGWQLQVVPGLVPAKDFFELLAKRVFPVTCWLRTLVELDYIEEPDMFHDVFGHVPLLMNDSYAAFLEGLGKIGLQWIDVPDAITMLGRIYWFTIEFGLLSEHGMQVVFGSGIISSVKETMHSISNAPVKHHFDIDKMMSTDYRTDSLQETYFIIDSFEQLCNATGKIEQVLNAKYACTKDILQTE